MLTFQALAISKIFKSDCVVNMSCRPHALLVGPIIFFFFHSCYNLSLFYCYHGDIKTGIQMRAATEGNFLFLRDLCREPLYSSETNKKCITLQFHNINKKMCNIFRQSIESTTVHNSGQIDI
jgi:hypothetical protein